MEPYGTTKYENVIAERKGRVGLLRLNRPQALNALCAALVEDLGRALDAYEADSSIGCVVVTGSEKAFAAGADIKEMSDRGYMDVYLADFITKGWQRITTCRKPVIAAVSGFALGGGCEMAMMCDFIIAADNAKFGQVGPMVGSFDGGFGASVLTSLVGPKKAKEMWFLCRMYSAEEALEMGLVNTVVPLATLEDETVRWCREMLDRSPFALRLLKASFHAHEDGFAGIQQLAHDANLLFYGSEEAQEGRDAYKQKRKPDFSKFPRRP